MGMEDFGKKPVAQGEAGFLTQEQLDEMNGAAAPTIETVKAEAPVEDAVDSSWVDLAGGEQAPVAPLSPERRAEVMEQIGHEETRLNSNLAENETLLGAAEAKMNDPAVAAAEAPTKPLLTRAKIGEAYDKAKSRINELAAWGGTAGLGIMASSMFAGIHAEHLKNAWDLVGADHWNEVGTKLVEGGLGTAAVVGGVWALSRTINWMKKKAGERKVDNAYRAQAA